MMRVKGQVWCDHEGQVHDEKEDPFNNGPRYPQDAASEPSDEWVLRDDPEYTESALYFYICPGEHRIIWAGRRA